VVRERVHDDPPCTAFILADLEGELFFGAAPELDRHLTAIQERALAQGIGDVVLRLKRVRNPDVVCMERFEHFLRDADARGLRVRLAGVRPDFLEAATRLRFQEWLPADRVFPEQDDRDSATLGAVRDVYARLGEANACPHCKAPGTMKRDGADLYYLV
jgi:SulP family sulfate permease